MALVTRTLANTGAPLTFPNGTIVPNGTQLTFTLVRPPGIKTVGSAWDATSHEYVGGTFTTTATSGVFSVALWPNDRGNATTQYLCKINAEGFLPFIGVMPSGLGTYAFIDFMLGGRTLTHADLSLLDQHIADMSVHLTPAQNTFLDGLNLPSLTATEVNYMDGVTSSVQTQLNAKQPLDATLTNFAALTITANVLPFGNGNDTFSTCAFTSFARTLVASADAATARGILGVAAGASVPTAVAPIAVTGTLDALTITTTMATNRLLGRTTAGTGVAESIAPTAPLSLNAGALALVATNAARLFGRQSGSAGNAQELTVQLPLGVVGTELTTVIDNPSLLGRGDAGTGAAREMTMLFPLKLGSTTVTTEIAGGTLMGRTTPGNGPMEAITPGDGLTLASGVLSIDTETINSKLTTADTIRNHVVSGFTIDAAQAPDIYVNAGVGYANGKRVDWPGGQIGVSFDLDYYIDLTEFGPAAEGVTHGNPAPTISPGFLRIAKFASNGATFSGITYYSLYNLAAGVGAGLDLTTGSNNVFIGCSAGGGVESGNGNTVVGAILDGFSPTMADTLILGTWGDAHITSVGAVTTFSKIPVLPIYTKATLPTVVPSGLIYVSNGGGGSGALCFGNGGGAWIDTVTGVAV